MSKKVFKVVLAGTGATLIMDDIFQHTIGSPFTGKTPFVPTQLHHGYIGALLLALGLLL
jgi:hypothetical protein